MRIFRPQHAAQDRSGQEACGDDKALDDFRVDAIHGNISQDHILAKRPNQRGQAHHRGTGGDALSKWQAAHAMKQRHGDDPAPDPQQSRTETGDGTHETTGVPADIVILCGVIILLVNQLHDVHVDHIQQKCPEKPLERRTIDLVAQLHSDEDENDTEGEDVANGVPADGLGVMMLDDRGHRDEDVHDHRRRLREMLVMAEDQGQDRDHDDRTANAQQPAHSSGDETDNNQTDQLKIGHFGASVGDNDIFREIGLDSPQCISEMYAVAGQESVFRLKSKGLADRHNQCG